MKTEFMKIYEELEQLTEANTPAARFDEYALYTADSPVRYKIYWPNAWFDADKTRYENSGIPFKQAVEEIVSIISELPREKKFGITISCEFLIRNTIGVEAFYLYTFAKEYKKPATLRFNTRSATPAPDFVRDAGQKIIDILEEVANFIIEEEINVYEELDALNEVFTYTEDEILSDEELKDLTDKIAALKPQEEKASADWRAIRNKLKADNVAFMRWDENPEYNKALAAYRNIRDQIWPLESKLKKHNEAVKYKSAEGQLATEEDWDRILDYEWEVEVEDLEVEVYREESEYESGWDPMHDSIIYTTIPAQSGYITSWTVSVEVTKEHVAEFLGKEIEEVTIRDIMDLDEKAFTEHLATYDEIIDRAIKEAEEAADSGDYDYDDVSWNEDDDWEW